MNLVEAQKEAKAIARKFSSERWYLGCGVTLRSGKLVIEVKVDRMCKNLAMQVVPTVQGDYEVCLTPM